jgi:hypothetical protein
MHCFYIGFHFAQGGSEKNRRVPIQLLGSIQYLNPIDANRRIFRNDEVEWIRPDQIDRGQCMSASGDMESFVFE